jgi:hypothetical protein
MTPQPNGNRGRLQRLVARGGCRGSGGPAVNLGVLRSVLANSTCGRLRRMETVELEETEAALREFAEEHGLSWVVAEFDEAVALGVVEVKKMRQANRKGETFYEELPQADAGSRGRKRAEEFLSRRPMTALERVEALLSALRRVLVDLDTVAEAAVSQLNDLPEPRVTDVDPSEREPVGHPDNAMSVQVISEMDFLPDEGSTSPPITTEAMRHGEGRADTAKGILDALDRAVRS